MSSALNLNLVRGQILQITFHLPTSHLTGGSAFRQHQYNTTDKFEKLTKIAKTDFATISLVDANYKGSETPLSMDTDHLIFSATVDSLCLKLE